MKITYRLCAFVIILMLPSVIYAQEANAIDQKGTRVSVRNTIVTTAATPPAAPLQNDIWFDTTAEVTKIFDGTAWLTINLDALAKKEDSANKSSDTNLADGTNTKFPTELAVKTYVDTEVAAAKDDDITGVSFDGTNLKVDEGATSFSANLSGLRDSDWYQANGTTNATDINQNIYTLGNVGIGTDDPQRGLHLAGGNSIVRLSRSSDTAAMIFDRYSGAVSNTLKSFQFGLNASAAGVGEFFFADYNENVSSAAYTKIMSFTDGNEVIKFNQYGTGSFTSTASSFLLGVESDGNVVEVDISSFDTNVNDDFDGDFTSLSNIPTGLADGDDDTQLTDAEVATAVNNEFPNLDTDSSDDFDYQGLNDTYFPYYNGTQFVDGLIRQQGGKITMNGAAPKYALNVFGTGLSGRLFFHGNAGDNPGIELATDATGTRRVLMRMNESGTAGTEITFYTRPDSGGAVNNHWTMKNDGVFDFQGKGIRRNVNQLQFQKSDNTWQDFEDDGDNNSLNEIQSLSILGNELTISGAGGNAVTLPDTQLTEAEVDTFVSNNGYSTGAHTVDTNTQLTDTEVALAVNNEFPNLDADSTDDFSGDYNDLVNRPSLSSIYENDGTLTTNRAVTQNNFDLNFDANTLVVSGEDDRVGIGTTAPDGKLHLYETIGTLATGSTGSLLLEHGDSGGSSSIVFKSAANIGSDYGYIQFSDDGSENGSTSENGLLEIGVQDDGISGFQDDIAIIPSGNMGVATRAPSAKLDVNGDARIRTLAAGSNTDQLVTADANGNLRKLPIGSLETKTTISQSTTTGVITHNSEDGTSQSANVVSTNTNNSISSGTDGGAYYNNPTKAYGTLVPSANTYIASGISSATKVSVGRYTFTMSTTRSSANYPIQLSVLETGTNDINIYVTAQTTTTFSIAIVQHTNTTGVYVDKTCYFTILDF